LKALFIIGSNKFVYKLISGFHRAFLLSVTFIGRLMHSILYNSKFKIYVVSILKDN